MRKVAIFVEGQTELIVVREFLLRKYNYEVNIDCIELFRDGNYRPAEYDFSNPVAKTFYQIVNVGNDQKVASIILEREVFLFNNGFEKVLGLRDMYSKVYRELAGNEIKSEINTAIIEETNSNIRKRTNNHVRIFICFSIMEIESWFLALYEVFKKLDKDLTIEFIREKLNIDLSAIDPETVFFHPAATLSSIFNLKKLRYDKHKGDIEAICNHLCFDDYQTLYASDVCNSFKFFYDNVA